MKNTLKLIIVISAFILFCMAGCRNHSVPTDPNATHTPSAVGTATPVMVIDVAITRGDNHGLQMEQFMVMAMDSSGSTLSAATITLSGPTGVIGLPSSVGYLTYSSFTVADCPNGAQFYISVTSNSVNYNGTFTFPSAINFASDGSSISWPYTATIVQIGLTDPLYASKHYGPGYIASPFNVTATNIFNAGPGDYDLMAQITVMNTNAGFMNNPNVLCILTTEDLNWQYVTRY